MIIFNGIFLSDRKKEKKKKVNNDYIASNKFEVLIAS